MCGYSIGRENSWWLIVLMTVVAIVDHCVVSAIPEECINLCYCRWKHGKQTVECLRKNLTTVPQSLDSATQVLDLSYNRFESLSAAVFRDSRLVNLQDIALSHCVLKVIDARAFIGLTNLVKLDLSHNLLKTVPAAALRETAALRTLQLNNNDIDILRNNDLAGVPGLVQLHLSDCRIRQVEAASFDKVRILEQLSLSGNRLERLAERTVVALKQLHNVKLHANPWHCDCRLRPLHAWLTGSQHPYALTPTCHAPPRLAGQSFNKLADVEFACRPRLLPMSRHVLAAAGDNATLECRVSAVPPPRVVWFQDGRPLPNSSRQMNTNGEAQPLMLTDNGNYEYVSRLLIPDVRVSQSRHRFVCVAANRAGDVDANFTLTVDRRLALLAPLDSGQIAGIVVGLLLLLVVVVTAIFIAVAHRRRRGRASSLPPGKTVNDGKPSLNGHHNMVVGLGGSTDNGDSFVIVNGGVGYVDPVNPVQKPPRLNDFGVASHHFPPVLAGGNMSSVSTSAFSNTGGVHYSLAPNGVSVSPAIGVTANNNGHSLYAHRPDLITELNANGAPAGMGSNNESLYGTMPLYGSTSVQATSAGFTDPVVARSGGGYFNPLVDDSYELRQLTADGGYSDVDRLDPSIYGYPADYGLPVPEASSHYDILPSRAQSPPQPAPRYLTTQVPPEPAPSTVYHPHLEHSDAFNSHPDMYDHGQYPGHHHIDSQHHPSSSSLSSSYVVDERQLRSSSLTPHAVGSPVGSQNFSNQQVTAGGVRAHSSGVPVLPVMSKSPAAAEDVIGGTDV